MYEDGKFAYSHHNTDPISGQLVNSFDLVRIHLYGAQDEDMKEDTPINRLPSYKAMQTKAQNDEQVKSNLLLTKYLMLWMILTLLKQLMVNGMKR